MVLVLVSFDPCLILVCMFLQLVWGVVVAQLNLPCFCTQYNYFFNCKELYVIIFFLGDCRSATNVMINIHLGGHNPGTISMKRTGGKSDNAY